MLKTTTHDLIRHILQTAESVAIVGISPKSERPSNQVACYLLEVGYTIIPVNPGQKEILGQKCYPNLKSIPDSIDIVGIFRKPAHIPPIVEEAIQIKASVVWMQEGIINEKAASRARRAGLTVIMDRCLKTDHLNLVKHRFI